MRGTGGRVWLIGPALLALAACASDRPAIPPPPTPIAGAPVPVAGYDWFYATADGEAELEYGVAETDDVPLGLFCSVGSGDLAIRAPGPRGASEIHLESGGDTERFPALAEPSALHDGDDLSATAPASHPVFLRFRRVGWIAIWHGNTRETLVPHPAARDDIERFFATCG